MLYPIRSHDRILLQSLGYFAVLLLVWSYLFKITILSNASGVIKPSNKTQYVQHLEGGIVRHIFVKEGAYVHLGDPLVQLDQVDSQTKVEQIRLQLEQALSSGAHLESLLNQKKTMVRPEQINIRDSIWNNELTLFQLKKNNYEESLALKSAMIDQAITQTDSLAKSVELLEQSLSYLDESKDISEDLFDIEISSRIDHLARLEEVNQKQEQLNIRRSDYINAKRNVEILQLEKQLLETEFEEQNTEAYQEIKKQINQLTEALERQKDQLNRTLLKAPSEGVVQTLNIHNAGEVILPGETVATITPTDNPLIIEAKIPISDIGWIQTGMKATIRLPKELSGRYPPIDATVTYISSDRIIDDTHGHIYYKSYLYADQMYFGNDKSRYDFHAGMSVDVNFIIGKRRLINYIIDPILNHTHSAISEP